MQRVIVYGSLCIHKEISTVGCIVPVQSRGRKHTLLIQDAIFLGGPVRHGFEKYVKRENPFTFLELEQHTLHLAKTHDI